MNSALPESSPSFIDKQTEFTNYIRDPQRYAMPNGIKIERMLMYRELLFNNVNSFLTSNFPILYTLLDEHHWLLIVQDFFSHHRCETPYFSEIPEEFINYLQHERPHDQADPPYMLELAHYEWVEMALSISHEELPILSNDFVSVPENYRLSLSPLAWPLLYRYPVHRLSPEFQPDTPPDQPSHLVIFRTLDYQVKFLEVTAMTYRFLQIIAEQPGMAAKHYLQQLVKECPAIKADNIIEGGINILRDMATQTIIYGSDSST